MNTPQDVTTLLLTQINTGEAKEALLKIEALLLQFPLHLGLLVLRAEALRVTDQSAEAIIAFRQAGAFGGGARNWMAAGHLLAQERRMEEALVCLRYALADDPDNAEALNLISSTLFNLFRAEEALPFAKRLLSVSEDCTHLSNAALILQHNKNYEEVAGVFKRILATGNADLRMITAAAFTIRSLCDHEAILPLDAHLLAAYETGNYALPEEFPATNVAWCANEKHNLGVAQSYLKKVGFFNLAPPRLVKYKQLKQETKARIRVGYLSDDFHSHAVLHLMVGVFEAHDRANFEVFAYDHSVKDGSIWQQRFLAAIEHHIDVSTMSDTEAANKIEADQLDILIDLKGHTGMARLGIMARRPAPLQATFLGFPGGTGADFIDYIISDRFVTPDSSKPFYTEKLCRLPHSYQCNDDKRAIASENGGRAAHGLPEDKVVFCVFNQAYKLDAGSFSVWMRILKDVPKSVLWLLEPCDMAKDNLRHYAKKAGIAPERLIFAPFTSSAEHLARLQLADVALDSLIYNGHTTNSDALWAGTPVVTARGTHFPSRVSESLLNAINLPELVGEDREAMIALAVKLGKNKKAREALRQKIAQNAKTAPLFDTARFTRNFEAAIGEMVKASRAGGELPHLDIVDVQEISTKKEVKTKAKKRLA